MEIALLRWTGAPDADTNDPKRETGGDSGKSWRGAKARFGLSEAEDARQLHREIEVLRSERKRHRVRIRSLLLTQGIDAMAGPGVGPHKYGGL